MLGAASEKSSFEIGLLDRNDWSAKWIDTPIIEGGQTMAPAPIIRTTFQLDKPVVAARLHITALGLYHVAVNGQQPSDDWFRPGWTDYSKRLQYQTYDIADLVQKGANAVGVVLGDGWWSGRIGWTDRGIVYGGAKPALLAQIEVTHDDGSVTTVGTDRSWKWSEGPVRRQDIFDGEEYDARHEIAGWASVDCDESSFRACGEIDGPGPDVQIVATRNEPVKVVAEIMPIDEPTRTGGGARLGSVFDLGQNFTGVVRLKVKGEAGTTIRLRYAEMLKEDGTVYTENLRSARCTDTYTLRGDPNGEVWTPRFTFHGFRYVEATFMERYRENLEPFTRETITGIALSSAVDPIGSFECSDSRLNQLQSNIRWGQLSNFLEVPTDCPQRDERLGWTGDAQVFAPTAAFNFDVASFFTKWSHDIDDAQMDDGKVPMVVPNILGKDDGGPGWSDARVLCAWACYQAYGDVLGLEAHYAPMVQWLEWQATSRTDGIRCGEDCGYFQGFSDWLALDSTWGSVWSATPKDFIGTAYFASTAGVMAQVADLLGHKEDADRFRSYREESVTAWNREFVTPSGRLSIQTQTSHLMALGFDLLPEEHRPAAFERLLKLLEEREWHLSTGFLGTPLLCPVLSRFGRTDVAYRVLMSDEYPGWLFPVANGATTMWERWNGWTPDKGFGDVGMNSFNHYAYGAIGRWIYDTIGGLRIDPDAPGYRRLIVQPEPGGDLTWAKTSLRSTHGLVSTSWTAEGAADDRTFSLQVTVPANVIATVVLPDGTTTEAAAGTHSFTCRVACHDRRLIKDCARRDLPCLPTH